MGLYRQVATSILEGHLAGAQFPVELNVQAVYEVKRFDVNPLAQ